MTTPAPFSSQGSSGEIAIIGLRGRFPGAENLDQFWSNLASGRESISFFDDDELRAAGIPAVLFQNPRYVKANGVLAGVEWFDAAFFEFSRREAEIMDPQHRLLLECAWELLESAGYNPEDYPGSIACYAGASLNTYLLNNLLPVLGSMDLASTYQAALGNDKDYLCTRISYKLNLTGPSLSIQTGCSTSLVAVHAACQSLLSGECDLALAGGVSILVPQRAGYLHQEGMVLSPDGHCRAFDARARGTVSGNGLGLVLLKRFDDARADRDEIHATIKGSAVNNDGAARMGYTAPGVEGQMRVVAEAQSISGVEPDTISYLEAHGTATELGDPIEIAALTESFRKKTARKQFCAIGSVKTNIGHLDAAAGIAGLIKTVLMLKHRQIPPSLFFEAPNPGIDFEASPFYVNTALQDWKTSGTPRRAGVSSFGIGGTNAHLILEEGLPRPAAGLSGSWHLLLLSARSESALASAAKNLSAFLESDPSVALADVAYTLQVGRKTFAYRRAVVCRDRLEAIAALAGEAVPGQSAFPEGSEAAVWQALGAAWLAGEKIDWPSYYQGQQRRRISLPTYPFERQRYWIAPESSHKAPLIASGPLPRKPDLADWFYYPVWKRSILPSAAPKEGRPRAWVLFLDGGGLAEAVAEELDRRGDKALRVTRGSRFQKLNATSFSIRPDAPEDYDLLGRELRGEAGWNVLHSWSLMRAKDASSDDPAAFYSFLFLGQSLNRLLPATRFRIIVMATGLHDVFGTEEIDPGKAALLGLAKVMPQEFPNISCSTLDLDQPTAAGIEAARLVDDLWREPAGSVSAFRNGQRWLQVYEPVRLPKPAGPPGCLRQGGVYLITGGLGEIGFHLAKYLAATVQAKLILIGRTSLPAEERWDDWPADSSRDAQVRLKIEKVRRLRASGAEVLALPADVTDEPQMRAALEKARARFGAIHGVIHAAGARVVRPLDELSRGDCEEQFRLKGRSARVLEGVLRGIDAEFCVLISSLSSVLGAVGFAAYASAHALFDAVAQQQNRNFSTRSTRWIAINWDNWRGAEAMEGEDRELALAPEEGVAAFERILANPDFSQVAVSTTDLPRRIERWVGLDFLQGGPAQGMAASQPGHSRPELRTPWVAPRNEIELALAGIWSRLLGVQPIGVHDNFFELGGDSIISIQVVSAAGQAGIKLNARAVFECQTVAELAGVATRAQASAPDQNQICGEIPLSPIQRWFFERELPAQDHFNQFVTLSVPEGIQIEPLAAAFQDLLRQHDALRLRFERYESGWRQFHIDPDADLRLIVVDLSGCPESDQLRLAADTHAKEQTALSLAAGRLLSATLVRFGPGRPCWLSITIHHLAVDGFSWRILCEDLRTAYEQRRRGERVFLPRKTSSFKDWSMALAQSTTRPEIRGELDYWCSEGTRPPAPLPVDLAVGENDARSAVRFSSELSAEETDRLIRTLAPALGMLAEEIILASLGLAVANWTGQASVAFDLEGNGRAADGLDLSRTVGWFTSISPVMLELPKPARNSAEVLHSVREQFRRRPQEGRNYSVLRYLLDDPSVSVALRNQRRPELIFLYLGRVDVDAETSFAPLSGRCGFSQDCRGARSHLLEVEAMIREEKLRIDWIYSANRHRRSTIENLAAAMVTALRGMIADRWEARRPLAAEDFPEARLSETELRELVAEINRTDLDRRADEVSR